MAMPSVARWLLPLAVLVMAAPALALSDPMRRATTGRVIAAESAALPDSLPGVAVECVDVRSGNAFAFRAQRLLFEGRVDSVWAPDSGQTCLGTPYGQRQLLAPDAAGGAFVGWVDRRGGESDIYVQRFTGGGEVAPGWPEEGRAVCSAPLSQYHLDLVPDGEGGVYLAWEDFRAGADGDVYLQRLGGAGDPRAGWPAGGREICGEAGHQGAPRLAEGGGGGVFVVWQDHRAGQADVYVQRLDGAGEPHAGWPAGGAAVSAAPGHDVDPVIVWTEEIAGLVAWRHEGGPEAVELRAALLGQQAPDGAWPPATVVIASGASEIGGAALAAAGAAAFVAWGEWTGAGARLRIQRLSVAGALAATWPAGGIMLHDGEVGRGAPALRADENGVIALWEDFRDGQSDIYAARAEASGEAAPGWPAELAVCVAAGDQYAPLLAPGGSAGAIVTWADAGLGASGQFLSSATASRPGPRLLRAVASPGRARITWSDGARGHREYRVERQVGDQGWTGFGTAVAGDSFLVRVDDRTAPEGQRVAYRLVVETDEVLMLFEDVVLEIPRAPAVLALHLAQGLRGEPAIQLALALPRGQEARLELMDVAGRRVAEQSLGGLEPGEHQVRFRLPGRVAAGVYFVRLIQGREVRNAKVIYLR